MARLPKKPQPTEEQIRDKAAKVARRRGQAFKDYLEMEPPRSIQALYERYLEDPQNAPSTHRSEINQWAFLGNWKGKAEIYDRDKAMVDDLLINKPEDLVWDGERHALAIKQGGFPTDAEAKMIRMRRNNEAMAVTDRLIKEGLKRLEKNKDLVCNDAYFFEKIWPVAIKTQALLNKEDRVERGEAGERVAVDVNMQKVLQDVMAAMPDELRALVMKQLEAQGNALPSGIIEGDFKEVGENE